jgi:hypothetical protein
LGATPAPAAPLRVSVGVVAPLNGAPSGTGLLLTVHWYDSVPALEPTPGTTAPVNVASPPATAVWLCGCAEKAGGTFTSTAASWLVTDADESLTVRVTATE